MSKTSIWIVTPPGYAHSHAFDEFAIALSEGFKETGIPAPVVRSRPEGDAIVLGANLLPHTSERPPRRSILFNLEQLTPGSPWWSGDYIDLLRRRPVWDYSVENVALLKSMGIPATLCKVGYASALERIEKNAARDIDVLFYGSMNPRRAHVLEALNAEGIHVVSVFNVYGSQRDDLVARSKIVLNMHYFESRLFEVIRVSYLLANGCCVVSEKGHDSEAEREYAKDVAFVPYEGIVHACLDLLRDDARRRSLAAHGLAAMRARAQSTYIRAAIESSSTFLSAGLR